MTEWDGMRFSRRAARWLLALVIAGAAAGWALAQQTSPERSLSVQTQTLPKALTGDPYQFLLQARGGITPFRWRVSSGSLPAGITLRPDGLLDGVAREPGEFRFVVTVSDSGVPVLERNQELVLQVLAPLFAQWSHYPRVVGARIEGSVKVSNQTGSDFDLTFIVVAVNEHGRATALGYQHFTLKVGTTEMEIPFGETLPSGSYQVNVDVVGEVPTEGKIYRARLVSNGRLSVQAQ